MHYCLFWCCWFNQVGCEGMLLEGWLLLQPLVKVVSMTTLPPWYCFLLFPKLLVFEDQWLSENWSICCLLTVIPCHQQPPSPTDTQILVLTQHFLPNDVQHCASFLKQLYIDQSLWGTMIFKPTVQFTTFFLCIQRRGSFRVRFVD